MRFLAAGLACLVFLASSQVFAGPTSTVLLFAGPAHYAGFAINLSPDCIQQHLDGGVDAILVDGTVLTFAFEAAQVPLNGVPCALARTCPVFGDAAAGWAGPCIPLIETVSLQPRFDGSFQFEAASHTPPNSWFVDGILAQGSTR